ncbi:hypothetical protein EDD86DRAFT_245787 [Gorgonomyces haynaldii]|nr:hypothetical protein EDD86DRAFT_245787 [Gorgonomyces haynaldii]
MAGKQKDKVNCSFYFKIGACRHGEKCSRKHVKPNFSQTLLLPNLYQNPAKDQGNRMSQKEQQQQFDLFYEDMFIELSKYGQIEEMNICDNTGDHLLGNVYTRFKWEADAGRPLYAELSPVTDFGEACCRQYENGECNRGGFCNFMHLKEVTPALKKELFQAQTASLKIKKEEERRKNTESVRMEEDVKDRVSSRLD